MNCGSDFAAAAEQQFTDAIAARELKKVLGLSWLWIALLVLSGSHKTWNVEAHQADAAILWRFEAGG